MVHLFRGGRGRGLPRPHAPVFMSRHMRPDFIPPYALPRGNLLNRPMRPGPMPLPRMLTPPLPLRPRLPPPRLPIRDLPYPLPIQPPIRGLGIPPGIPPGPPLRGLIRPQPPIRGRGGFNKRGATVKRLVSANGRAKKPQKRKEKTEAFFCETCDRGWNTEEKLLEHVAQHQVCGRDGCTFTAHPKVVLKHTQVQHDSGLYHRIAADVDKWIAERKSRFPTKENVEKKTAQVNEMIKRGERMPTQGKRFQNKPNNENWRDKRQRTRTNYNKSEGDKRQEKPQPRKLNKPCDQWKDPDAWRGDLPQFPGTAAFPLKDDDSSKDGRQEEHFSDDEEWTNKPNTENSFVVQPTVSNILASLMVDYGSDMSDGDEDSAMDLPKPQLQTPVFHADDKQVTNDLTVNIQKEELYKQLENSKEGRDKADSDSGPEECAIDHEDKSNISILNGRENKDKVLEQEANLNVKQLNGSEDKARYKHVQPRTPMKRLQLSLLEKLLKNEIRHERNLILQCVRYVVKNNFLVSGNLPAYNVVGS